MKISLTSCGLSEKTGEFASIALVVLGATLVHSHLWIVRSTERAPSPVLLWLGVLLISFSTWMFLTSSCLGRAKSGTIASTAFVFAVSLTLIMMRTTRYGMLNGTDIVVEDFVARNTLQHGWSVEYGRYHSYYSLLSTTVLPTVLASVTGLDSTEIFMVVFQVIGAIIPIVVFLLGREVFGDNKVAVVGALLYSESRFFFELMWELTRFEIVTILYLLTLYLILKQSRSRLSIATIVLLLVGMSTDHLTQMYFFIVLLIMTLIGWRVLQVIPQNWRKALTMEPLSNRKFPNVLPLSLVIFLSWFLFVAQPLFKEHVGFAHRIIEFLLGDIQSQYHGFAQRVFLSSRGPLISSWEFLVHMLTAIGVLYLAFRVRKRENGVLWMIWNLTFVMLFIVWVLVPFVSGYMFLDRLYLMALPLLCPTLSILLWRGDRLLWRFFHMSKTSAQRSRSNEKLGSGVFLMLFLSLNLIMNISLPIYGNLLLYYPDSGVRPEQSIMERYDRVSWFEAGRWVAGHTSGRKVYTDERGGLAIIASNDGLEIPAEVIASPEPGEQIEYVFLHDYYLRYGYWVRGWIGSDYVLSPKDSVPRGGLFANVNNVICSNGFSLLLRWAQEP